MERNHGPPAEGAGRIHSTHWTIGMRAAQGEVVRSSVRLKWKFRSFLPASFQNLLSDQVDRIRRLKRGGDQQFVQLDVEEAEERDRLEPAEIDEEIHALRDALIASEGRLSP